MKKTMKKNLVKILTTIFCMVCICLTMAVACFADEVAEGEIVRLTIVSDGNLDAYMDSISIAPSNNIRVVYTLDGQVKFDGNAYYVNISEVATSISVEIYETEEDYNNLELTVGYSGYDAGVAVFEFYGLTSYQIGNEEGITMEVVETNDTVNGFFGVVTEIMDFMTDSMGSVQTVFYVDGSLTMLGALSVIAVALAVSLLIVGIIRRFVQLG